MADIFPHSPYSTQRNTTYTYTIVTHQNMETVVLESLGHLYGTRYLTVLNTNH